MTDPPTRHSRLPSFVCNRGLDVDVRQKVTRRTAPLERAYVDEFRGRGARLEESPSHQVTHAESPRWPVGGYIDDAFSGLRPSCSALATRRGSSKRGVLRTDGGCSTRAPGSRLASLHDGAQWTARAVTAYYTFSRGPSHPRILAGDFAVAVRATKAGYRAVMASSCSRPLWPRAGGPRRASIEHGLDLSTVRPHVGWERVAIHLDQAAYLLMAGRGGGVACGCDVWRDSHTRSGSRLSRSWRCVGRRSWCSSRCIRDKPVNGDRSRRHRLRITSMFSQSAPSFAGGNAAGPTRSRTLSLSSFFGIHAAAAFAVVGRSYTAARWRIAVGAYLQCSYLLITVVPGGRAGGSRHRRNRIAALIAPTIRRRDPSSPVIAR
jgi:hypothetical protein